jgi:hypothetical protein
VKDYTFGYGYSGFSVIQQVIDEYIFSLATSQNVSVYASITFM